MTDARRIYVVLPRYVEVPTRTYTHSGHVYPNHACGFTWVDQPLGRQAAQACHVSAKLRHERGMTTQSIAEGDLVPVYEEITTIILACRDSREMMHIYQLLSKHKLFASLFSDLNPEAYGSEFRPITALAVRAIPSQVVGILDYLPLWGKS